MRIKKVTSYVEPKRVDGESSPTTVYVNKNIRHDKKIDFIDGMSKEMDVYTYDMYMYSKSEFELVEQFIAQADELEELKDKVRRLESSVEDLTRVASKFII